MYTPRHSTGGAHEIVTPHSAEVANSPRLNDDAAERRRRRKSAIERRRSNIATPRRLSTKAPLFNQSPQLLSPAPFAVQLPRLTPEELNQRYEEWMKIAADNKINANNTWDFALIDYFYDMSLLREGDSINFQKASCTLDGCVKIYSSRVDSVASETGRLLSGLAEAPGKRGRHGDDDGDEDGEGDSGKQKSRRQARSATTLAKDFASISVKKLDLEFSVDPLFKKTSADFDEGGARGLLLNHLGFDAEGRIVFDASDSSALVDSNDSNAADLALDEHDADDADDGVDAVPSEQPSQDAAAGSRKHKPTAVDLTSMSDIFGHIVEHLDDAHICPSLADFEFTRDTSLDFSLLREHLDDEGDGAAASPGGDEADAQADYNYGHDDADGDDMGDFLRFDDGDDGPVPLETASTLQHSETEEAADSGEGMGVFGTGSLKMAEDEDNLLSYFDTKLARGWAGPEHWRLPISRAAMHKQMQKQMQAGDDDAGAAEDETKRKRAEKQVFYTDFMNAEDVRADVLFAKPPRASAITMSKKAVQNQNHTLPEDVHFSSKNLFNLLLKPKLKFNPRRATAMSAAGTGSSSIGGGGGDGYGGFVVDADDGINVFSGLENAQFDDDGGPRFDDADDYDDDVLRLGDDDGDSTEAKPEIPALKLIKPLHVNYARRAKRVNVKKLKENIWREMAAGDRRRSQAMGLAQPADIVLDGDEVALGSNQKFSEIIGSLKNVYPPDKLEDLSVSFCFICLLHLANERNLRIEGDLSLRDLVITQDRFD
ncbi:hypothetical protein H4R23_000553 [Coemansia sp. Cherry 401B]|nr:hypothetical protein IWW52_001488 [Coemansia sp. RSA 2704]KAJ2739321.1 hypothetical protein H4R23_000553 [Coemansia sp. Cherry 401B]